MKRLKGIGVGRLRDEGGRFECDEIVLELDQGPRAEEGRCVSYGTRLGLTPAS